MSPVHFGEGWVGLGLSLRIGGVYLVAGGDSAGEVFAEYIPLIWLTPWSSLLPGKCVPFCTCEVLDMLANNWSSPRPRLLALEAKGPAEVSIKRSIARY